MPTPFDLEFVPMAFEMLEEDGRDVTIRVQTQTPDPDTGTVILGVPTDYTRKCVPRYPRSIFYKPGDVLREESAFTIIAAQGLLFTPELGQLLTFVGDDGTKKYRAVNVLPIESGEQIAAWEYELSR